MTHKIMPRGAVTRYVYDRNDQLIQEITSYGYEAETDCGKGTVYQYDSRGNRIRETNALGELVEERGYNLRNEPIQWTDGFGTRQEMEYTLDGQVREVRRGRIFPQGKENPLWVSTRLTRTVKEQDEPQDDSPAPDD